MPCFARQQPQERSRSRRIWRTYHVIAGLTSLPFVLLVLYVTLAVDLKMGWSQARTLTSPVVFFWVMTALGCLSFTKLDSDTTPETVQVFWVLLVPFMFMCAIVVTLFAYQESTGSGGKMVPLFVYAPMLLLLSLSLCSNEERANGSVLLGCTGMVLTGGTIGTLICVALKNDGNLHDSSWAEVFIGTWVADVFCVVVLVRKCRRYCLQVAFPRNFAFYSILTVMWICWLSFRILFVISMDNKHEYYGLGKHQFVKQETETIPLFLCGIPLFGFSIYMLCGGFNSPMACAVDKFMHIIRRKAEHRRQERAREKNAMDDAKRVARQIFQNGGGAVGVKSSDENKVEMTSVHAVLDETEAVAPKEPSAGKEVDVNDLTSNSQDVQVSIGAKKHMENQKAEWSEAMKLLGDADGEEKILKSMENIVRLLETYQDLRQLAQRTELITVAKRKQATQREAWTKQVALAFRNALGYFSPAKPFAVIHQLSSTLNPFRKRS